MASTKAASGFIRVPSDLLEALCLVDMPDSARRVFLCVLRKTVGFGKAEDWISVSQYVAMTGLNERRVWEALAWLKAERMITRSKKTRMTGVSTDVSKWKSYAHLRKSAGCGNPQSDPAEIRSNTLRKSAGTIDTLTIDTFTIEAGGKKKAVENPAGSGRKRPYIEGDPAFQDPVTQRWRVRIHTGEYVDYVGKAKPEWR